MTYRMADSINTVALPEGMDAYAGYVNGAWPTYPQIVERFPKALHLSIAVNATARADCLDVERGDATPGDIPGWMAGWQPGNTRLPVLYCSAAAAGDVIDAARATRGSYLLWTAHYTGVEHICGPGTCGFPQADGTQWLNTPGYDQSLLSAAFYPPPVVPDPPPAPPAPQPVEDPDMFMEVWYTATGQYLVTTGQNGLTAVHLPAPGDGTLLTNKTVNPATGKPLPYVGPYSDTFVQSLIKP